MNNTQNMNRKNNTQNMNSKNNTQNIDIEKFKSDSFLGSNEIATAYIHVPFCKNKCFYCDFNSFSGQDDLIENYFVALNKEIRMVYNYYNNISTNTIRPLDSIYIGGGTPSFVPSKYILELIETIKSTFGLAKDYEMTIECNPGTVDYHKMASYKACGINRISIGLQSASDSLLKGIGRIHDFNDFEKCIDYADKVGLNNRNIDLMFGLPNQKISDVIESIEIVLTKNPTHISFYSLILEEGTLFYEKFKNNQNLLPSEDLERHMYWTGVSELEKNGFLHYEISNLAKEGYFCRQNNAYWMTKEYYGFGSGAHSYQNFIRIENEPDIRKYIIAIDQAKIFSDSPAAIDKITLSTRDREQEFFMLGFRILKGINSQRFEHLFAKKMDEYLPILNNLADNGYIRNNDSNYFLTKKGIDFANQVFMEFV